MSVWFNFEVVHFIFRVGGGFEGSKTAVITRFLRFLSTGIREDVVQKCPVFQCVLLVQFSNCMLSFSGRRELEGSKTAVITRFIQPLSTGIHEEVV